MALENEVAGKSDEQVDDLRASLEAAIDSTEVEQESVEVTTTNQPAADEAKPAETSETLAPEGTDKTEPPALEGTDKTEPPAPETVKVPGGWKADAREHWAKLPTEVQREVSRRESEIGRLLYDTQEERKTAAAFKNAATPFEAFFRSEGVDGITAYKALAGNAYTLRTGAPEQKAQLIAGLIKNYGVDIDKLDAALTGHTAAPAADTALKHELDQLKRQMADMAQAPVRAQEQAQINEIEKFAADTKNEFFNDVRVEMGALISAASDRGQLMTLQQAYEQACYANPETRKVLSTRTINTSNDLASKKAASVSVKGAPRSSTVKSAASSDTNNLRATIEAAMSGGGERA